MKGVGLDFDTDKKARTRGPVHVVTASNRDPKFTTYKRSAADEESALLLPSGARPGAGTKNRTYVCAAICCCLVIIGAATVAVVLAVDHTTESGSTTQAENVATTTAMTTAVTAPQVSEPGDTPQPIIAQVSLNFLCNHVLEGADAGQCLSVFSYDNPSGDVMHVPHGANNYVLPGPKSRGQTTAFSAGQRFGGASFKWDCQAHTQARWTLRSGGGVSVATAPRTHIECPPLPM